jgi:phytoene/squalene synthetase
MSPLDAIAAGHAPADPMFARLAAVLHDYSLPQQPLRDLLSAFSQDVTSPAMPTTPPCSTTAAARPTRSGA